MSDGEPEEPVTGLACDLMDHARAGAAHDSEAAAALFLAGMTIAVNDGESEEEVVDFVRRLYAGAVDAHGRAKPRRR